MKGVDVDEVVVEQLRHAIDGPFDGDVALEKLEAIGAVVEKSVELVYVLHGDLQALSSKQHVLQASLNVLVGALQEAVELVDVLEQDVGHVGDRLLQVLVQQVHAEDDLGDGLEQRVELPLGLVSPMAVVCEVPGVLGGVVLAAEHVLALLYGFFGVLEGHEGGAPSGVEHGLLEGALHGAQRVDGEGHGEVVLVAVLALRPAGVVMGTEVAKAPSVVEGHHLWHGGI